MALILRDELVDVCGHVLKTRWIRHNKPVQCGGPRKPVLVFLHEGLGCVDLWGGFPERVIRETGLNGFLYDRLGHGKSDPLPAAGIDIAYHETEACRYLPALLDKMEIRRCILIGHSDGGSIALLYAAKHGGVCGVITEAAHVFVEARTLWGIRRALQVFRDGDLKQRIEKHHGVNGEVLFRRWADTWTHASFLGWDIQDSLPMIACPVLAIQGDEDEYGTTAQAVAIASQTSGYSRVWIAPNCRHIPHRQACGPVVDVVCAFIADQCLV